MYEYPSSQIGMMDFNMPLGMKLDPGNRWVRKARTIPWDAIEARYASLFSDDGRGNRAKPLRMALGALLIQVERKISDEEVVLQIQETPCLQYFCGLAEYTEERSFDPSLMVHFRNRLSDELNVINEMIIDKTKELRAIAAESAEKNKVKKRGKKTPPDENDSGVSVNGKDIIQSGR